MDLKQHLEKFSKEFKSSKPVQTNFNREHWEFMIGGFYANGVARRNNDFNTEGVAERISKVVDFLAGEFKKTPWLYLAGNCGNGKTTMLYALSNAYRTSTGNRKVFPVYTASEITALSDADFYEVANLPRLIIDDLGTESLAVKNFGNVRTPIIDLLCIRYNKRLVTAISTNKTKDEISDTYGRRIADRLEEMAFKVVFDNDSYRKKC